MTASDKTKDGGSHTPGPWVARRMHTGGKRCALGNQPESRAADVADLPAASALHPAAAETWRLARSFISKATGDA